MKKEKDKKFYSITKLVDYCNETFKTKKNGRPFTISDVTGYVSRGKLPNSVGGQSIVLCTEEELGGIVASTNLYKVEGDEA